MLDLRGNGGGLLTEAVPVSSIFIEDGRIVSVRGRARPERVQDAEGDAIDKDIPVVVLADGRRERVRDRYRRAPRPQARHGRRHAHVRQGPVQEVERLSNEVCST